MAQSQPRSYSSMADDAEKAAGNAAGKSGGAAVAAIESVTDKAKELASNAGEFVGQAKEKVQEWAHSATDKVKEAAAATGEFAMHAKDKVKEAATATGEFVVHAKDKVQEMATTAAHSAGEAIHTAGDELTRVVRRYPVQSLLVGAAIGYLLGRATSRS